MNTIKDPQAITIRQPATANLMIDSADRNINKDLFANNFSIQKPQALVNGFFHRIGTSEVVLEWKTPNISGASNVQLNVFLSTPVSSVNATVAAIPGFYNITQCMNMLSTVINEDDDIADAGGFSLTSDPIFGLIFEPNASNAFWTISGPIADDLLISPTTGVSTNANRFIRRSADLRPTRYLDFVSPQLTYNQELKDNSTAPINRDVLNRWYFAWDNPTVDENGYPILMGYEPFCVRRLYNPPKQIRWDPIQPLGNLSFQVYNDQGVLAPITSNTNWLMTLQLSED